MLEKYISNRAFSKQYSNSVIYWLSSSVISESSMTSHQWQGWGLKWVHSSFSHVLVGHTVYSDGLKRHTLTPSTWIHQTGKNGMNLHLIAKAHTLGWIRPLPIECCQYWRYSVDALLLLSLIYRITAMTKNLD